MRSIDLTTADGLPPLPMHLSWVRDGILVVGMDNEVHVYSQWRGAGEGKCTCTHKHCNIQMDRFEFYRSCLNLSPNTQERVWKDTNRVPMLLVGSTISGVPFRPC